MSKCLLPTLENFAIEELNKGNKTCWSGLSSSWLLLYALLVNLIEDWWQLNIFVCTLVLLIVKYNSVKYEYFHFLLQVSSLELWVGGLPWMVRNLNVIKNTLLTSEMFLTTKHFLVTRMFFTKAYMKHIKWEP